jgi:hypothetical protein
MELDWSEQSPHIRTLFRPWRPGDGYDEATLQAAEARLGVRLPATLRTFYLAWGRRRDLTRLNDPLLSPDALLLRSDTVLVGVENQCAYDWGVPREALEEANPPVVAKDFTVGGWQDESELPWTRSHDHLSSFLDDLTYGHAFSRGGAIHGGWTDFFRHPRALPAHQIAWLEEHWSKAKATSLVFGLVTDSPPTLYVRDGQAFWECGGRCMAAREAEVLDELGQRFQLTWATRW